jgi:hypothetical protein
MIDSRDFQLSVRFGRLSSIADNTKEIYLDILCQEFGTFIKSRFVHITQGVFETSIVGREITQAHDVDDRGISIY